MAVNAAPPQAGIFKPPNCRMPNGWVADLDVPVETADAPQTVVGVEYESAKYGMPSLFALWCTGYDNFNAADVPQIEFVFWLMAGAAAEPVLNKSWTWAPPEKGSGGLVIQQSGIPAESWALSVRVLAGTTTTRATWRLRILATYQDSPQIATTPGRYTK